MSNRTTHRSMMSFPSVFGVLVVLGVMPCSASGDDYGLILQPPSGPWHDVHVAITDELFAPTFTATPLLRVIAPGNPGLTLGVRGSPEGASKLDLDVTSTPPPSGGVSVNLILRMSNSWCTWETTTAYFTDNEGGEIPGSRQSSNTPFLLDGAVSKALTSGKVSLQAASQTGAGIASLLYASSSTYYASPTALLAADILTPVVPTGSPGLAATEVHSAPMGADQYHYWQTTFTDGSEHISAIQVPGPGPLGMCLIGLTFIATRQRLSRGVRVGAGR